MSNTLSPTDIADLADLRRLFGEVSDTPQVDTDERDCARFIAHIRGLLAEATHEERMSVVNLAKALGTSKAAVSRHLRSDGDIRASTMWQFAKALNRKWKIELEPIEANTRYGHNFFAPTPISRSSFSSPSEVVLPCARPVLDSLIGREFLVAVTD